MTSSRSLLYLDMVNSTLLTVFFVDGGSVHYQRNCVLFLFMQAAPVEGDSPKQASRPKVGRRSLEAFVKGPITTLFMLFVLCQLGEYSKG